MKLLWKWVVYSSVNAEKISLTAKGIVTALVTAGTILLGLGLGHTTPIGPETITEIGQGAMSLLQSLLLVASTLVTLGGMIRKLYTTANQTNEVIGSYRK
jgi:hypothetical protein